MHVLKGKKMPGHMGSETVTIQNLEIVSVDLENNVILVKGNVPGPKKSLVLIKTSVKKGDKANKAPELITYSETVVEETAAEEVETPVEETPAEEVAEETKEENVG
jgi:large subunit ribosomal protein L3